MVLGHEIGEKETWHICIDFISSVCHWSGPQVGLEKAMPFPFSTGAGHSTYHLAHYLSVEKSGRAAFPGQECQKGNVCFSF